MSDIRNDILRAEGQAYGRQRKDVFGPGGTTKGDLMRIGKPKARSPWKRGPSPAEAALKRTGIMQAPFPVMKQKFFGG